jgi:2-oxoisovalerate dehydrogenase E2 component (dihydrolipoyl transacylase)
VSQEIVVPDFGEVTSEITFGAWLKQTGDSVQEGEVIAEVITEKVNAEIPSPVSGTVEELLVDEGDMVVVGQPIARVAPTA